MQIEYIVPIRDSIQRIPLLQPVVPFIGGVAVGCLYFNVLITHRNSLCLSCLFIWAVMALLCVWRKPCFRIFRGGWAMLMFFMLGTTYTTLCMEDVVYEWPQTKCVYKARVVDYPRERNKSMLCVVEITAMNDSSGRHGVDRKVFAYMPKDSLVKALKPGEMFCFYSQINLPHNFSEELPFDYAHYVAMQGAAGTVYIPVDRWKILGRSCPTLRERMLCRRQSLIEEYMSPAFSGGALGILSAITLGEKNSLADEVRASYADAGAAHVLALSGLHVAVIYALLSFVMQGIIRKRQWRWLSDLITVGVLWVFALLVGLSASVARAVAMCTTYTIARWVSRDSSSINVLLLVAFGMLIFDPLYLFDVGFQLSFTAMAGILLVVPHLEMLYRQPSIHPVPAYLLGVVAMSLAAQLGTFPLVLYHFGTFPTYFLLTNMMVVPCLYVVLIISIVWWMFALFDVSVSFHIATILEFLVNAMNEMLSFIGNLPGAVVHVGTLGALTVVMIYLTMIFVLLFLLKRWPKGLLYALFSLLFLLISLL